MNGKSRIDRAVNIVDDLAGLSHILDHDRAAVIWKRDIPANILEWLNLVEPETLPRGRVILMPQAVEAGVRHLCDLAGLPDGDERDWFAADVAALADQFSKLMEAKYIRLRLDVVTTNACRKFHVDAVTARLVCTYRGTGTQYGLKSGGADPEQIFATPIGAPILLRGTCWPEAPSSGLLHRSPPIEGSGETRLLLVIDPVTDLEADAGSNTELHAPKGAQVVQ